MPQDLGEPDFQLWVLRQANELGWCAFHVRDSEGVVQGVGHKLFIDGHDCAMGFPDLVLVRPGAGVLYRELKTNYGYLSRHQRHWRNVLLAAGADWAEWRPRDEVVILEQLRAALP